MGKAANSGLFAVLLLATGWWWLGLIIAIGLLVLKLRVAAMAAPARAPGPGEGPGGMILWLTTFVFSVASALLPFLPMEAYILGAGAAAGGGRRRSRSASPPARGATIGKIVWYEAARRGIDSEWAQKKLVQPEGQGRLREVGHPDAGPALVTPPASCSSPRRWASRRCW